MATKEWNVGETALIKTAVGYTLGTVTGVEEELIKIVVLEKGKKTESKFHFSRLAKEYEVSEEVLVSLILKAAS